MSKCMNGRQHFRYLKITWHGCLSRKPPTSTGNMNRHEHDYYLYFLIVAVVSTSLNLNN
jgi:hypothetical protein